MPLGFPPETMCKFKYLNAKSSPLIETASCTKSSPLHAVVGPSFALRGACEGADRVSGRPTAPWGPPPPAQRLHSPGTTSPLSLCYKRRLSSLSAGRELTFLCSSRLCPQVGVSHGPGVHSPGAIFLKGDTFREVQ